MAEMMRITGKTYDYKHLLVEYGGTWDKESQSWTITKERWELLLRNCVGGFNKKAKDQSAAIQKWVAEPIAADAKADAIAQIKALMAAHAITVGDL